MKGHAKPFLLYGRMLSPLIPGIPGSKTTLTDKKTGTKTGLFVPLIRQSAWRDEAGNIGVFAINTGTHETVIEVPAPADAGGQAVFYVGGSSVRTESVPAGGKLRWPLAPGRLASIVFKSNR
jgi:hypothetical protein